MPIAPKEAESKKALLHQVGEEIVKEREARGWSRTALASVLGVETQRLGRWERGERQPPLPILYALKEVLGVPK